MSTSRFATELATATHSVSFRTLLGSGVPERAVRGPGARRSSYGHYTAPLTPARRTPTQRILDAVPLVPAAGAIGGWASAYVHGADWLDGISAVTSAREPVMVVLGSTVGRGQHGGVRCVRHRLPAEDVTTRSDLTVTSPLRTAFDGMRLAPDLAEALVAADALLHFGVVTLAELQGYVDDHRGWAGVERARRALAMADGGVLSPWESRLRALYVGQARLPLPLVNPLLLGPDGRPLGRPDLFDPEAALAVEFDGEVHRERQRHSQDNVREELFEGHGVTVVRVDSLGYIRDGPRTVWRLRDGHRRGLRRPRANDRWQLAPANT